MGSRRVRRAPWHWRSGRAVDSLRRVPMASSTWAPGPRVRLHVLVVGGSGLLGAPATRALLARGHDVSVLTRAARAAPAGASTLVADRRDSVALSAALAGRRFDVV